MKTKKYWIVAIGVCCCVSFLVLSVSGISSEEKQQLEVFGVSTLKGLRGVSVKVSLLATEGAGSVTENALQTKVELELRKAGIKVFSDTDPNVNTYGVGRFIIIYSVNKMKRFDFYGCCYSVNLYQYVQLLRNPKIFTMGLTWPLIIEPKGFSVGRDYLEQGIKDNITTEVNTFINDYLAANPKEQEKTTLSERLKMKKQEKKQGKNSIYD